MEPVQGEATGRGLACVCLCCVFGGGGERGEFWVGQKGNFRGFDGGWGGGRRLVGKVRTPCKEVGQAGKSEQPIEDCAPHVCFIGECEKAEQHLDHNRPYRTPFLVNVLQGDDMSASVAATKKGTWTFIPIWLDEGFGLFARSNRIPCLLKRNSVAWRL